ncbi:MAG: NADP-dependent malic enzyme [Bacteroidia bacterium]|nr:NADP-dependent malic enzyme [Bacteroidia bacterium]
MLMNIRKEDALSYHSRAPKGKIGVESSKPVSTQRDLSLAYSPGVAYPCLEIAANKEAVYDYTIKGNLVAVLTNGTAVLGLGNIGPEAAKPVMEGKGVLFKKFAGIDVFDIEISANTVEEFIMVVKALEPTFGGINLEDIKAPEAFEIERRLRAEMNIPIMHDDQHGTAIISAAALVNALQLAKKKISNAKFVVSGAGAAALSCCNLYLEMGARRENIYMFDVDGFIHLGRKDLDPYRKEYAHPADKEITLLEAFTDADVFLGLSAGGIIGQELIKVMAPDPIVLALANPEPEIKPELVHAVRKDAIMATGRSDYANQVNNVLGFPYIFRGALDVRASEINEAMKVAASRALAELAHEPVPEEVNIAYSERNLKFGREYLIPKPMDPRLITRISVAVARAAMESGVARKPIASFSEYEIQLQERVGLYEGLTRRIIQKAQKNPKRVVFANADTYKILKAAQIIHDERIATPVLLGNKKRIAELIEENDLDLGDISIVDPLKEDIQAELYGRHLYEKRKRKGLTLHDSIKLMRDRNYFGIMMTEVGVADAFISGLTKNYPTCIRPALQVIGRQKGAKLVAGMHILKTNKGPFFFADTTVNKNPTAEDLVEIARLSAQAIQSLNIVPRIAMVSYSNFGSNIDQNTEPIIEATRILQDRYPNLIVDGDIQADIALRKDILKENYSFSQLADQGANTFIFPNLMAGNIAYKLMEELGNAELIGPVVLGMKKPVHILSLGSSVRDIVNMTAIAVVDAQTKPKD